MEEEQKPRNNKQFNKKPKHHNKLEELGLSFARILIRLFGHQLTGNVTQITVTYEGGKYDLTKESESEDSRIFVTVHEDPKPKPKPMRRMPRTQKSDYPDNPDNPENPSC